MTVSSRDAQCEQKKVTAVSHKNIRLSESRKKKSGIMTRGRRSETMTHNKNRKKSDAEVITKSEQTLVKHNIDI